MIKFTRLFYKNFLSTGNAGTTLFLDRNTTTLIQGVSGAGKSTMIDALCFGLFGRPFRNINKPQLINSINQKQCEVQVDFELNGKKYRVLRSMKPNKFDIFVDDKLLTQDAAVKDYQKVLEQQILMMSFKTFSQIVILGSTAYTPFMQLNAGSRREVIEDILDIGIFSTMNLLLKQQVQETKDTQAFVDTEIKTKVEKAEGLKRLIKALSEKRDETQQKIQSSIAELIEEQKEITAEIEKSNARAEELSLKTSKITEMNNFRNTLLEKVAAGSAECDALKDRVEFFRENDECPVCSQSISETHKHSMVSDLTLKIESSEEILSNLKERRDLLKDKILSLSELVEEHKNLIIAIKENEAKLSIIERNVGNLTLELSELMSKSSDIDTPKKELKVVAEEVLTLMKQKKDLAERRKLQENASTLLRDTGIKTAIIREYLPIINKLLNKYLNDLELFVNFELDESFNEVIKSRHRDEFTYGNFSEGEKLRIDLALLFTWRHIAKLKNSASCNLLILDEILVGRLDQTNQDIVLNMINTLAHEGTNVFAIAHHDGLQDKFRGLVTFEKSGDFSVMKA